MKRYIALFIFINIFFIAPAQQYYFYNDRYFDSKVSLEVGVSIGLMNSLTDVGGRKGVGKRFVKDLSFKTFKPSFSIYTAANISDVLYIRLEGTFGSIESSDKLLESVKTSTLGRYERNLSFRSSITDFMLAAEIHPLMFKYYDDGTPDLSPYLLAGVGLFSFNPQAKLNNTWHNLQPLKTEGQGFAAYPGRKPYQLTQVNFPVGLGVRYEISAALNARFEIVHRILNTDYLDDVSEVKYIDRALFSGNLPAGQAAIAALLSDRRAELNPGAIYTDEQRGNPGDNDAFFSVQLKIGYTFRKRRR
jgi:hypothetical protein